jgi:hypothetical protein
MNRVSKVVAAQALILRDISLSFFPGAKIGVARPETAPANPAPAHHGRRGPGDRRRGEAASPASEIGLLSQEPQLDPRRTCAQT